MLWQPADHEPLTATAWDEDVAHRAIDAIVEDAHGSARGCLWEMHPHDTESEEAVLTSLYMGSAGVLWGLHQLDSPIDLAGIAADALARYRAKPDFGAQAHAPSLHRGRPGVSDARSLVANRLTAGRAGLAPPPARHRGVRHDI